MVAPADLALIKWDSAISRVGGHPLETTMGDHTESKITSTHTILTTKWNSTQQLKVLETRSTRTPRQTSWVEPPDTGFVSNLDSGLAIPGGDITGLVALSLKWVGIDICQESNYNYHVLLTDSKYYIM
jgi:hypothetical protein